MFGYKKRKLQRELSIQRIETLIRIAGTPTIHSSEEAKMMAKAANNSLDKIKIKY